MLMVGSRWSRASRARGAADFSSYYVAVKAVNSGDDPYKPAAVKSLLGVGAHPFFYPPPFLAVMQWVDGLPLMKAFRIWFWLDEFAALGCVLVLWLWWRPLGPALPVALFTSVAALTAIPNNHVMGQFNLPVLLLALLGLWGADRQERHWQLLGGGLLGVACMLKMSPALLVLLLVVQRRWNPVLGTLAGALVISLLSLVWVPVSVYVTFFVEILPGFSSGDYNGLRVPILMYGNHSIPNMWQQLFPGKGMLSDQARLASAVTNATLVLALGIAFRKQAATPLAKQAQLAAVMVAMLLIPVYTYEHHLVWAIPAAVICMVGVYEERLPRFFVIPLGIALVFWAFDLAVLKRMGEDARGPLRLFLQEGKFVALWIFLAGAAMIGRGGRS